MNVKGVKMPIQNKGTTTLNLLRRKDDGVKSPHTGLVVMNEKYVDKLLDSIEYHYNINMCSMYLYPFNLFSTNVCSDMVFNNSHQLIRLYEKRDKVFEHGCVYYSLIRNRKRNRFMKRKVFVKELPLVNYETYLDNIDEADGASPLFPNIYRQKINDYIYSYNNPSYVDVMCHYLCSRLTEDDILPHFPLFYGAVATMFRKYTHVFGSGDEYDTFLDCYVYDEDGSVRGEGEDKEGDRGSVPSPESCHLEEIVDDISDINSEDLKTMKERRSVSRNHKRFRIINKEDKDKIELRNYPVCLMATELLNLDFNEFIKVANSEYAGKTEDDVPITTHRVYNPETYNKTLLSILFQTITALTVVQNLWKMCHNDLHLGNIMLNRTKQTHLNYYVKGAYYRVPTFGMIVKIIDWNRATLVYKDHVVKNNVYFTEGECAEMYYWDTTAKKKKPVNEPNPSFDLGLLAYELLTHDKITDKKSKLHKMLMDWLNMDGGGNVYTHLREEYGEGDDGGFELYRLIATTCRSAVPKEQFSKPIWQQFKVDKSKIPKEETIYTVM